MDSTSLIVALVIALAVIFILASSIRVIRQQRVGMVERLGRFNRTLEPGPHLLIPVLDKVRYNLDMRENVIPFPPQGVITEDNLMVGIDSVIYFQIVDPERAAYEAQDYVKAIEQLTQTTLRNIIGGLDLEQTLTSREEINQKLRVVLDEATGKWGIKVNRVELRAIEPPPTIRDAMEKGPAPSATSAPRSSSPRASASRTSSPPAVRRSPRSCGRRVTARPPCSGPRPTGRPRCCGPRARRRRSGPCSTRSTPASPTRRCCRTSTCRCCRSWPRATRTRCGSSRAS